MKFAKQLALQTIPTWSDYYINYRALKKYLKERATGYQGNQVQAPKLRPTKLIVCNSCSQKQIEAIHSSC